MCCSPDKDLASLNLGKLLSFQNLLAPHGKVTKVRLGQSFCFSNPPSCTHGKGKFQMKPSEEGPYLSDVKGSPHFSLWAVFLFSPQSKFMLENLNYGILNLNSHAIFYNK